jgi:hypothetical protein
MMGRSVHNKLGCARSIGAYEKRGVYGKRVHYSLSQVAMQMIQGGFFMEEREMEQLCRKLRSGCDALMRRLAEWQACEEAERKNRGEEVVDEGTREIGGCLLVEMHLPEFQCGYQVGRIKRPCAEEGSVTDEDVMESLKTLVNDGTFQPENEQTLHWCVGNMFGRMGIEQRRSDIQLAVELLCGAVELLGVVERKLEELRGLHLAALPHAAVTERPHH